MQPGDVIAGRFELERVAGTGGMGTVYRAIDRSSGEPVAVTRLETGQTSHSFPQFLPDGRHFIYFVLSGAAQGIYVGSVDGGSSRRLANADAAAVISASGFLLFVRQTSLFEGALRQAHIAGIIFHQ